MNHYRINEVRMAIDSNVDELPGVIEKKLGLKKGAIGKWELRRRSIDARDKSDVHFKYTVDFWIEEWLNIPEPGKSSGRSGGASGGSGRRGRGGKSGKSARGAKSLKNVQLVGDESMPEPVMGSETLRGRAVIVGFGPCGIFAALELARRGYRPLVLERGPAMVERIQDVENFRENKVLNPEGNMLFGEGGAGTFSDGKIGTGIKDGFVRDVLRIFADAGAGEDITYLNKPHIGTDVLRTVIVNLRNQIIELGGEVRFGTRVEKLNVTDNELTSIEVSDVHTGETETIETNALILAIGHSARDTFAMINSTGLDMEQKPFSIGVRMEHPQSLIDEAQYGAQAIAKYGDLLPPADYKVATKASNGRGVYSFCMCPGGEVVVCTTDEGQVCVNGMSNRKRDSGTANSGILCDVRIEDYNNGNPDDVLAGVRFQEKYEKLAFINGGSNYEPPKSTMEDFLAGRAEHVDNSLPEYAAVALKEAVPDFARKLRGYDDPEAIITAVETRSSSPVRILRNKDGESNIRGIFPGGEGAGYAGGITSAACDGIRAARHIVERFSN